MSAPNIFPTEIALSPKTTEERSFFGLFEDAVVLLLAGVCLGSYFLCDACSRFRGILAAKGRKGELEEIAPLASNRPEKHVAPPRPVFVPANQDRPLSPRSPVHGSGSANCAKLRARVIELETVVADYAQSYGLSEAARRAMVGQR